MSIIKNTFDPKNWLGILKGLVINVLVPQTRLSRLAKLHLEQCASQSKFRLLFSLLWAAFNLFWPKEQVKNNISVIALILFKKLLKEKNSKSEAVCYKKAIISIIHAIVLL